MCCPKYKSTAQSQSKDNGFGQMVAALATWNGADYWFIKKVIVNMAIYQMDKSECPCSVSTY